MGLSMIGISIPVFVIAPILILVFAVDLHWLPGGGLDVRIALESRFTVCGSSGALHRLCRAADARKHGRGAE